MAKGKKTGSIIAAKVPVSKAKAYHPDQLSVGDTIHYMGHDLVITDTITHTGADNVERITFSFDNHNPIERRTKARIPSTKAE